MNLNNCQIAAVRELIPADLLEEGGPLIVELKSIEGLTERIWVLATPGGAVPYQVVADQFHTEGEQLRGFNLLGLRTCAVCVEVIATSPDLTREVGLSVGMAIPGGHLFAVTDEDFKYSEVYQPSGTPARAWMCLALRKARA